MTQAFKKYFSHAWNSKGTWRGRPFNFAFSTLLKFSSIQNEILRSIEENKIYFYIITIIYLQKEGLEITDENQTRSVYCNSQIV